ncbi:MAG: ATP synthase F1 subunit gamma [Syntrophorhabdaceae bacterium]|nr:ATP synthase F1 subunit gamma [Syntrophorhabdaceae bacterium]
MATLRDIKRKIGSIQSTQTITRTMKMVSASKLRRAQEELEKITSYATKLEEMTDRIIAWLPKESHPLLSEREEIKRVLVVAIASDRGLCGGFNMNVSLSVENFIARNKSQYERIGVYVFGRKIREYLQRRKLDIVREWTDVKKVDDEVVLTITDEITRLYQEGEFDRVYLAYNHFVTPVKQTLIFDEFIPIKSSSQQEGLDYLYEPNRESIINLLIPKYIKTRLYYAILDSQTAEHAARMAAMENATNNCGEMVSTLTLAYNKRRQESITREMMDIVGGAEALRGE